VRTFAQVWPNTLHDARPEIGATEFRLYQFVSSVERLDDVLSRGGFRIDVSHILAIKIDVEGMEAAVLRGAVRTLVTHRPLVMVEGGYWTEDVAGYLRDLGFIFGIREGNTIHVSDDPGTAVNGIFIHPSQFAVYRQIGLMH
jgi:Methyltransferase FkbM domain